MNLLVVVVASLACVAPARAQSSLSADAVARLAEEGSLTGSILMEVAAAPANGDAYETAVAMSTQMGCGAPTRVFTHADKFERAHARAGLDRWSRAGVDVDVSRRAREKGAMPREYGGFRLGEDLEQRGALGLKE